MHLLTFLEVRGPGVEVWRGAMTSHNGCGVQDVVDQHLRDRRQPPIMQAQFGGKVATTIVCRSVPYRSEKEEDFIQVAGTSC